MVRIAPKPSLAIVLLSVLAAVVYGIVHDQITARVCIEYFTIGHARVFPTEDPTWLGLGWGILAMWWVGVLLGIPLAFSARYGPRPKRSVGSLVRPLARLLVVMAICATVAGGLGWQLATSGAVFLVGRLREDCRRIGMSRSLRTCGLTRPVISSDLPEASG